MADGIDIPAWIALFIGLYSASAAIGELRHPGGWVGMVAHFERDLGLRFLTGIVCLGLGAAIYLVSPWRPGDWLAVLVTVIGGGMVVEGALILAFGDNFLAFARRLMGAANRLWAGLSLLLGAALIVVALLRL
ncbi:MULTISPECIES: hypothetical protein [Qipengyuania]|jgi:hypothetical protein|uniref:hypothetical protein n=1 Tax=Qipengyuania TaxID=1855416 RepID=UPI002A18A0B4|nr:hypothetical protein [Qipengyuania sp. HL-TH1]WPL57799.1 hypothetical protein SD421_05045 [Qipengyuania sp. HL-TH5]|tara:strand:- start:587 stop:985 length:399 start_codon:yes stop_codon:yes gene_type:complete